MSQAIDPKPRVLVAMVIALAVAGAAGWLLMAPAPGPEPEAAAPREVVATPSPELGHREPGSTPGRAPGEAAAPASAKPGEAAQATKRDRMARDLEREQIWSALRKQHELPAASPGAAAPSEAAAAILPTLDPQYVRSAIKEQLVPVAVDCYNTALQGDPKLGGRLVLDFVIVGAEDVGGIVEDAVINEETDLDDAFVQECMRESLMAVTFEPPPGGGRVEVSYPFVFEPE